MGCVGGHALVVDAVEADHVVHKLDELRRVAAGISGHLEEGGSIAISREKCERRFGSRNQVTVWGRGGLKERGEDIVNHILEIPDEPHLLMEVVQARDLDKPPKLPFLGSSYCLITIANRFFARTTLSLAAKSGRLQHHSMAPVANDASNASSNASAPLNSINLDVNLASSPSTSMQV